MRHLRLLSLNPGYQLHADTLASHSDSDSDSEAEQWLNLRKSLLSHWDQRHSIGRALQQINKKRCG
jgi:hypothetical protein